jgi:GT2 family glycosyltransferase
MLKVDNKIKADIVIIGKNDELKLKRIYNEDYIKKLKKIFDEIIYIDSNSNDQSIQYMKDMGASCYIIRDENSHTASAARHVGAIVSKNIYIQYMDSDMEFENLTTFEKYLLLIKLELDGGKSFIGFIGKIKDIYPNNSIRIRSRKINPENVASSFGGALFVKRESLLAAGNWRPELIANEELDLHARFDLNKMKIYYCPSIIVNHYTWQVSRVSEVLHLYVPGKSNRYGSWGKLLKSQNNISTFLILCKKNFEIVLFLLTIIMMIFANYKLVVLIFLIYQYYLYKKRSLLYNLIVPGVLLSLAIGFFINNNKNNHVYYEEI